MSIAKAFLVLLGERSMNGNQLRSEFEACTGATWPLNVGQAYTTLQRLERDGLVAVGADGGLYTLTESGARDVEQWWNSPVERSRPGRDELAIKLTLAVEVPGVDVRAVVRAQRAESMRVLHSYTRLKADAAADAADLSWRLLLESMVFQMEAEIRWLDHVEASVLREQREVASGAPVDPAPVEATTTEAKRSAR
ncbi:PadR family transcriptional regulator [Microbacterium halotolerans]|uniref:PadR family transcriptional regulator n=1 Tax=Microbacterium halotolerans TaxID=246613 RepID=UPI000E6ADE47|nr:PadR family transcriptional regulator [Microbacterium halotolerans]